MFSLYNDKYLYFTHYTHIYFVLRFPKGKTNKDRSLFDIVDLPVACIAIINHTFINLLTIISKIPG